MLFVYINAKNLFSFFFPAPFFGEGVAVMGFPKGLFSFKQKKAWNVLQLQAKKKKTTKKLRAGASRGRKTSMARGNY